MGILKSYQNGVRLTARKSRLALYLWAALFLYASTVVAPVFFWLKNHIGASLMGDRLMNGPDLMWFGDIAKRLSDSMSFTGMYFLIPVLAWLIIHIFLNGGVLGVLMNTEPDKPARAADFMRYCGQHAGPFFRLFLLSIPVYLLVAGTVAAMTSAFLDIFTHEAVSAVPVIIAGYVRNIVLLIVLSCLNLLFDYVKIRLADTGSRKVWKEFLFTFTFVLRNFFRVFGLYGLIGLGNIAVSLVYLEIARVTPLNGVLTLIAVFVWQQMYMLARSAVKVQFFASQSVYYRAHAPAAAPVEPTPVPPAVAENVSVEEPSVDGKDFSSETAGTGDGEEAPGDLRT